MSNANVTFLDTISDPVHITFKVFDFDNFLLSVLPKCIENLMSKSHWLTDSSSMPREFSMSVTLHPGTSRNEMLLMYTKNNKKGPKKDPWGTPQVNVLLDKK